MNRDDQVGVGYQIGPYELLELIGEGWMSAVYRAEHLATGRVVALKLMRAEYAGDAAFRERFVRGGANPGRVRNEHLVEVFDSGELGGSLYVVMRYVEGTDLGRVLKLEGPLDPSRGTWILSQVAEALDAMHAAGMVHRAVKPGNVLLDTARRDWAYLSDLGLTQHPSIEAIGMTSEGAFVSTFHYMAPEQILAQPLTSAVDVYALGCLLFEVLVGRPPFPGAREKDVLRAHIEATPPIISSAGGPAELNSLIAAALAKEPSERPRACGELILAAIDALGTGRAQAPRAVATEAPRSRTATLRVLEGPAQGTELTVWEGEDLRIGRLEEPPANLAADDQLSRAHARVFIEGDGVLVEDLGSTNGTFIDGERLTEVRVLEPGERLFLGRAVLELAVAREPVATFATVLSPMPALREDRLTGSAPSSPAADPERDEMATDRPDGSAGRERTGAAAPDEHAVDTAPGEGVAEPPPSELLDGEQTLNEPEAHEPEPDESDHTVSEGDEPAVFMAAGSGVANSAAREVPAFGGVEAGEHEREAEENESEQRLVEEVQRDEQRSGQPEYGELDEYEPTADKLELAQHEELESDQGRPAADAREPQASATNDAMAEAPPDKSAVPVPADLDEWEEWTPVDTSNEVAAGPPKSTEARSAPAGPDAAGAAGLLTDEHKPRESDEADHEPERHVKEPEPDKSSAASSVGELEDSEPPAAVPDDSAHADTQTGTVAEPSVRGSSPDGAQRMDVAAHWPESRELDVVGPRAAGNSVAEAEPAVADAVGADLPNAAPGDVAQSESTAERPQLEASVHAPAQPEPPSSQALAPTLPADASVDIEASQALIVERRVSIRLDLALDGGDSKLTVEPGSGVIVRRQPDGSWRVELT